MSAKKTTKTTKSNKCIACSGKGKSSSGGVCVPCNGTGKQGGAKIPTAAKKPTVAQVKKMSAGEREMRNEIEVMAVLHQRFNGRCKINGIEMLEPGRSKVWFISRTTRR